MSDSTELMMKLVQTETDLREQMHANAMLRQVISTATCHVCGEQIADQEWETTDDDTLIHSDCAEATP